MRCKAVRRSLCGVAYKDKPIFAAIGDGGNIIYVNPRSLKGYEALK